MSPSLPDLLACVDELDPRESGALVVHDGDATLGSVFVEAHRVCWAAAAGRRHRLRDLLRDHAERALDDAALDAAFARCRDAHRPLGEVLVEDGLVSDVSLRAALKQHTIESLIAQCDGDGGDVTWVPHRRAGYQARFAFAPVELLADAGAALYAREAAGADGASDAATGAIIAGSFAIGDDGEPVVVRAGGARAAGVRELLALGAWAVAALDACPGFSPALLAHLAARAGGPTAIAWRSARRLVHAAVLDERDAIARAVAELARRRLPAVATPHLASSPEDVPPQPTP